MPVFMYWLIAFMVLLVLEIATLGLTTIWFAGGALVAMLLALFQLPVWLQIVAFLAVSGLLLAFTRPLAMKYLNKSRVRTNVDSLIGMDAIVEETIENLEGKGSIKLNGLTWTARSSKEGQVIQKGTVVTVLAVEGVKAIVKPRDDGQAAQ